jgi:LysM repeat protein
MGNMSIYRVFVFSVAFLACLSLTAGCSSERAASKVLETTTARAQADVLVHDAQAELAAIRRDLAAARIATSKQEGEAAELRRKTTVLEADRAELRKMLEQAHSAANALQIERNELKQTLVQTQAVGVARQDSGTTTKVDGADVQADMKELKARMAMLTEELAQMKQRVPSKTHATSGRTGRESSEQNKEASPERVVRDKTTQPRIVPSALFLDPSEPASRPGPASDLSPQQGLIRVRPGDSLWKLAHERATTIDELKRINGLTTDVVHPGQRLILPSSIFNNNSP